MSTKVYFTKYTSFQNPISKFYSVNNGRIEKEFGLPLYKGKAERVSINFEDFPAELNSAKRSQAFGYGLYDTKFPDEVDIVVTGKEEPEQNVISRSSKFFKYRQLPGILMIDHDTDEYGKVFTPDELLELLVSIDPEIAHSAKIIRGSVSAGVHLKNKKPIKGSGFHIYIPVKNASNLKEYGELLYNYLWLKGHGYVKPSSNGLPLYRAPIDGVVFRGERIDIVGKPTLINKDDLVYKQPKINHYVGKFLDTSKLRPLSKEEKETLEEIRASAKEKVKHILRKTRAKWKKQKIEEIMYEFGITKEQAKKLVEDVLKHEGRIHGEWPLYFDNGSIVSVVQLLENPEKYDGLTLADPIDGLADRKKGKAKFWWNNGNPIIISLSHGIEKIYNLSKDRKKQYKEGVEPYYECPKYISREEAQKQMREVVSEWMNNSNDHFAITAPAGIGKTTAIVEEVAKYAEHHLVEIYVPRHDLANEIRENILKINTNLNVTVIRGRAYRDEKNKNDLPLCKKHELIDSIAGYGYNIYEDVCMTCPFVSGDMQCDYLKQYSNNSQVRIYTHTHLALTRKLDTDLPKKAIVDERFFTDLIEVNKTRIRHIEHYVDNKYGLKDVICNALQYDKPLLSEIREHFPDNLNLVFSRAQKKLSENKLPDVDSNTDPETILTQIKNNKIRTTQLLSVMLNQLQSETDMFPERQKSLTVRSIEDEVVVVNRKNINRFHTKYSKTPVLCIDADYRQQIAKIFFHGIKNFRIDVERNAHVTQILTTTNAKSRGIPRKNAKDIESDKQAKKNYIKNLNKIIENIYTDYGPYLLISYQYFVGNKKNDILPLLNTHKDCEKIHFGGLRGIDKYKHLHNVIVIGRNQLPVHEIESQAAALWWDSQKELVLTGKPFFECRGHRIRDGKKWGADVMICKDARAQLVQELHRECETLQAIDRVRLIHAKNKKNVFILCNLPLDITVDHITTQKELIKWKSVIEKALLRTDNGVLPLSAEYLAKHFSHLFTSKSKVKHEIERESLSETIEYLKASKKQLVFNNKDYYLYTYKLIDAEGKGKQGRHLKALAPQEMTSNQVRKSLGRIFSMDIEILDSTMRGLMDIKPNISETDDYQEQYDRSDKHYDSQLDVYYITLEE
ncbi:hypothetical protein [Methylomonas sp. TEB]|uniref:hypothetical protein n=1 Tax=Methylomonas sp. TEB TaxID=3398229 RepID=UPI0039F5708D